MFTRITLTSLIGVFLMGLLLSAPASAELDTAEKTEVRALIKSYLTQNPELLREVLTDLAMREQQSELDRALAIAHNDAQDGLMGNPDGDVTIYEFSDYNCGYCKRVFVNIQQVLNEDPNLELRVKEFPILSQSSVFAAKAGLAAQRQGKFADFHRYMMTDVGAITEASTTKAARIVGLDMDQFTKDMADPKIDALLATNAALAKQLEITGTPGLLVGNIVVPGAISAAQIRDLVARVRADQKS